MNSQLLETLKSANLDVAVAAREGKLQDVSKLPSIEALKKALGADAAFNIVCNGSCNDPVEGIEEKFTHVIKSEFQFERLKPVMSDETAFNIVCNGSCIDEQLTQLEQVSAKK